MQPELPVSHSGEGALQVAREAMARARAIIREAFGHTGVASVKGRGNVLTETDLAVEGAVTEYLLAAFPGHAVLSEETAASTRAAGWMWVLDPIDGTKNFSQGIPHFCTSLALCYGSEPRLGLILQPLLDEEYLGLAGAGAWLNGQRLHVSGRSSVSEAVFAADMGYDDRAAKRVLEAVVRLWPGMQSLRVPGSAALGLAYVAAGRYDLFVQPNLFPWDLAAGLLLVQEAGGVVTAPAGTAATIYSGSIVAGTPGAQRDFLRLAGDFAAGS